MGLTSKGLIDGFLVSSSDFLRVEVADLVLLSSSLILLILSSASSSSFLVIHSLGVSFIVIQLLVGEVSSITLLFFLL